MQDTFNVWVSGACDVVGSDDLQGVLEDTAQCMRPCNIWLQATRTGSYSGPHTVTSAMTALQDHGHIHWDVYIDCR